MLLVRWSAVEAAGRLLVADWFAPHGPWDDSLMFIFDGGVLHADEQARITVQDSELSEFRSARPTRPGGYRDPYVWRRFDTALHDGQPTCPTNIPRHPRPKTRQRAYRTGQARGDGSRDGRAYLTGHPEAGQQTHPSGPAPGRPSAPEHTTSAQPSTLDVKTAPIRQEVPGQSLDQLCAARDSNPEPAD